MNENEIREGKKMSKKAGFCRHCNTYVWITENGNCEHGHNANSITEIHIPPNSDFTLRIPANYIGGHPEMPNQLGGEFTELILDSSILAFQDWHNVLFEIPIKDITDVRVETQGQIEHRVTVSRMLAVGILAFGMKKREDRRIWFLLVSFKNKLGETSTAIFQSYRSQEMANHITANRYKLFTETAKSK